MPKRTREHNAWLLEQLTDPQAAASYLDAAISDSQEMFLIALRNVAEAHKMSKVADMTGLGRESLYKTLSEGGNPRFDTLDAVLNAVGVKISIQPRQTHATTGAGGIEANRIGFNSLSEIDTPKQTYSNSSHTYATTYNSTSNGGAYSVTIQTPEHETLKALAATLVFHQAAVTEKEGRYAN